MVEAARKVHRSSPANEGNLARCGFRGAAVQAAALAAIGAYRVLVSPLLPSSCRFYPSCSAYAAAAIRRYGVWRGVYLATRRLLRCHPWHPGGHDPVP